jgi:Domain of unknown function (DUF4279)
VNDSDRAPQISAWLTVTGVQLDPDDCTRQVGMTPTRIWYQPEHLVGKPGQLRAWSVGFERQPFDSLDQAVVALLSMVWAARQPLRDYVAAKHYEMSVTCNVTIWQDRPEYILTAKTLRQLAELECEIGLDIFDYSQPEKDHPSSSTDD